MIGFICALDVEVEGIKNRMTNVTQQTVAKILYVKGEIDEDRVHEGHDRRL